MDVVICSSVLVHKNAGFHKKGEVIVTVSISLVILLPYFRIDLEVIPELVSPW